MSSFNGVSEEIWTLTQELTSLHNQVCFRKLEQQVINDFVMTNEKKLSHPIFVEVLIENVQLDDDFINDNNEYCLSVYRIIQNTKFSDSDMGWTAFRLAAFLEKMEQDGYINKKN